MTLTPSASNASAASLAASKAERADAAVGRADAAVDRRARHFFTLNVALGLVAVVAAAITIGGVAGSARIGSASRTTRFSLLGQHLSHPTINVAAAFLLALAIVGLAVVARGLAAIVRELGAERRFHAVIAARRHWRNTDVTVFASPQVQAFCAGLRRPEVYVSTAALAALTGPELDAVLRHERHHRRRRDPARIALGRVFAYSLFFLPLVGALHRRYCALSELAADDVAIAAEAGGARALASALLTFTSASRPSVAVGIAPERVDYLQGNEPEWRLPAALGVAAIAGAALLGAVAWQLGQLARVQAPLSLPLISSRPCIVVLALAPGVLVGMALAHLRVRRAA